MHLAIGEVDGVPPQGHQLDGTQAMPVGDQHHGGVAMARCDWPRRCAALRVFDGQGFLAGSVTTSSGFVTVRIGRRAISMEKPAASQGGFNLSNVTVGKRSREYLTEREVERLM
jgi:hypothetical protein